MSAFQLTSQIDANVNKKLHFSNLHHEIVRSAAEVLRSMVLPFTQKMKSLVFSKDFGERFQ